MFTKLEVDHSVFSAAPLRIPNIPSWLTQKPVVDLTLLHFVHQTAFAFIAPVFLRIYTMCVVSFSKSTQADQKPPHEPAAVYT